MEILHVVENLDDTYGGPSRSVPNLAANTRALGYDVRLLSVAWVADEENDVIEREGLPWSRFKLFGPHKVGLSPGLVRALGREPAPGGSVIHLHNLWNGVSFGAFAATRRAGVPLVVSPRGSLYQWSLSQGRVRKRIAWGAFQKRALDHAAFVHVTEPLEARRVRQLGVTAPIATVPNCVEQFPDPVVRDWIRERSNRSAAGRVFLFLSRIHKKKGLHLLLRAWSRSEALRRDGVLRIAGPSSASYQRELDRLVDDLGIGSSVLFMGMVQDEEREAAFREADVFVLPSHTENFGVAIAEALARGLPVLTTTGTPWEAVRSRGAGWWIDLSLDTLVNVLDEAATVSRQELKSMGQAGAQIARDYGCDVQAQKLTAAYEWVHGGPRPPFLDVLPGSAR